MPADGNGFPEGKTVFQDKNRRAIANTLEIVRYIDHSPSGKVSEMFGALLNDPRHLTCLLLLQLAFTNLFEDSSAHAVVIHVMSSETLQLPWVTRRPPVCSY